MSLKEIIMKDLKEAMKSKEKVRLNLVRALKSEIKYKEVELGHEISDDEIIKLIMKMIKSRKDSIEQYREANRLELAQEEEKEVKYLSVYMPKELSDEELKKIIAAIQKEFNLTQKKDMGVLIKKVLAKVASRADGKRVSCAIKGMLS